MYIWNTESKIKNLNLIVNSSKTKKCQTSKPVPKPPSKSTMEKLLAHKDDKSFG